MNYQNYDEYMRNILGQSNMGYLNVNCPNFYNQSPYQNYSQSCEYLETLYPDTYRIIYPMIVSACNMINSPITENMLEQMTDDIYDSAEADGRINIDIDVGIEVRENENNSEQCIDESRQIHNRPRNRFLRDLIKILLLRELLRRPKSAFPFRQF